MNEGRSKKIRTIIKSIVRARSVCAIFLTSVILSQANVFAQQACCAYCDTPLPNGIHSRSCPYYTSGGSSSGAKSSGGKGKKKSSHKQDMNAMIVDTVGQAIIDGMAAQEAQKKAAAAEFAEQQQKQKAYEAEKKARNDAAARESSNSIQLEASREKADKRADGENVLSTMIGSGNGNTGQLTPMSSGAFRWDTPRTDLQLMPAGSFPAPTNAIGQLQATAGFSKDAANAVDLNQAQMLAGQAQLVMPGGNTALQAPIQPLPEVPPASPPMRVYTKEQLELTIKDNTQKLQSLKTKLSEIETRKKAIQALWDDAKNMAAQAKQLRESGQPQDQKNADDLERAARELEESVKQQLDEVNQDTKALDDQIGQTQNTLEQDNATLKSIIEEDGK